jgi:hypothetical protein
MTDKQTAKDLLKIFTQYVLDFPQVLQEGNLEEIVQVIYDETLPSLEPLFREEKAALQLPPQETGEEKKYKVTEASKIE